MKLIDRYVTEVGRRLPLVRGRSDIEKELRSTLEDMLEDRARKAGLPADEKMEVDLLREYGSPDKVAATYNPNPYLIGPRIFPFFLFVLRIVLGVLAAVLLVLTGIQIATHSPMTPAQFFSAVGGGLTGIISALISAFGSVTLVFVLLERLIPGQEFKTEEEKDWDPASLMKEPEQDEVKIWEPITAIVFTAVALSIFNFNPQLIGIYYPSGDQWTVVPVLSEAFFRMLPWINLTWIAEILMNALLLRSGRWDLPTRAVSIAIKIAQIVIGIVLLTGPSILAITPESLQASGIFDDPEAARILGTMAQQGVRSLIALTIFLTGVDLIKQTIRLFKPRTLAVA